MADNFTVTPGVGKTIAADEISTVYYQRIKLIHGADGVNDGDVSTANPFPIRVTDGTNVVTVRSLTNSKALNVSLVDGNGDHITSVGGGTEYTEDAAAAANPVGKAPILVRQDTPAGLTSTDGDNVAQRGTNYGAAFVQVLSSSGSFIDSFGGGTQYTEDDASAANPVGTMLIGRRRDTLSTETTTDGDNTAINVTAKGEVYVKHTDTLTVTATALDTIAGAVRAEDSASADGHTGIPAIAIRKATPGNTSGTDGDYEILQMSAGRLWVDASGVTLTVNGSGVTQPVSVAAGATTIAKAEDVASADGDVGVPAMAVRKATPANTSGADGDYEMLQMSAGRLWVDASGVTLTVASHEVTNAGTFAVQAAGDVAHDAADSGKPQKIGGMARTTNPTAVADADRVNAIFDKLGKQVVVGSIRDLKTTQYTVITSSTSETTVLTAAGAGVFLDVYGVIVTNSSATTCEVIFKDSTAGSNRFSIVVPGTTTAGFMLPESAAHVQASANNNWTATCTGSVASIKITMLAVKNT